MKQILIIAITAAFFLNHRYLHAQSRPLDEMFPAIQPLPNPGDDNILSTFLNPLVSLAPIVTGILSFIMLILAGLKYISHAGNAQETKKASDMITYALVGLGLSAVAFWITRLLFMVGTGGTQTLF